MEQKNKDKIILLLEQYKSSLNEDCADIEEVSYSLMGIVQRIYGSENVHFGSFGRLNIAAGFGKDDLKELKRQYKLTPAELKKRTQDAITRFIDEINTLGLPVDKNMNNITVNQNVSQTQEQHQEQTMYLKLFLEAINDELTSQQRQELIDAYNSGCSRMEKRSKLFNKLKSFGEGVSASIVANLLTNRDLWTTISTMLI